MPSTARSLPFTLLRTTLLTLAAVLTTGTAATVLVAGDSARRTARNGTAAALDLTPFRRRPAMRALLDSLVAPLDNEPDGDVPLDSAALRRIVALTRGTERDGSDGAQRWVAVTDVDSSTGNHAQDALRRWARSAPLPPLWGYAPGFGGARTLWEVPGRSWPTLQRFVRDNEAAADDALLAGDAATAMRRARETIAAARHFLDQPFVVDAMVGRSFLQHGARLLARSARQADEPVVASQALRLLGMAREGASISQPILSRLREMGFDLSDGRLLAIARDTTLPPVLRVATLHAGFSAVCLRTRELLVGIAPARRAGLQEIGAALADLPRASEFVPLALNALDDFESTGLRDDPSVQRARAAEGGPTLPVWLVPSIVQSRASACRTM